MRKVGIILRKGEKYSTHLVTHPSDGTKHNARIMVKVKESRESIDPFDFRFGRRNHEALIGGNSRWSEVTFDKFIYAIVDDDGNPANEVDVDGIAAEPDLIVGEEEVECPAIVFVYLRDDNTSTYSAVKMVSHFVHGVPSSCAVSTKFSKQRNPDQYCSNIALKVNAKLANSANQGRAWDTASCGHDHIPWMSEVPTLVMGISLSSGLGSDSTSIVSGSACLDKGCMQFAQDVKIQTKTELIDGETLISLTKTLLMHYKLYNKGVCPQRVLVYRDGVSEGTFDRAKLIEIQSIRTALQEFKKENSPDYNCSRNCKSGCQFCCAPITYVVCMTQHNIRVVPASPDRNYKNNVISGTCLDHTIMDFKNTLQISSDETPNNVDGIKIFSEPNSAGYDFLLTSQGGLKGTSKPIYYRIILNENAVFAPNSPGASPLTKDLLETATYHMSFQYSTATKAVRAVPVVFYSSRHANMVMGYFNYLRGRKGEGKEYLTKLEIKDVPESERKHLPKNRDGTVITSRHLYVRSELDGAPLPFEVSSVLLPHFSPYNITKDEEGNVIGFTKKNPFRPHLSA